MLELPPSRECCDKDLLPSATDAMICTFECTFCRRLCGGKAWRRLSELRWKLRAAAGPAGGKAQEKSSVNPGHFRSEGLQPN